MEYRVPRGMMRGVRRCVRLELGRVCARGSGCGGGHGRGCGCGTRRRSAAAHLAVFLDSRLGRSEDQNQVLMLVALQLVSFMERPRVTDREQVLRLNRWARAATALRPQQALVALRRGRRRGAAAGGGAAGGRGWDRQRVRVCRRSATRGRSAARGGGAARARGASREGGAAARCHGGSQRGCGRRRWRGRRRRRGRQRSSARGA